MKPLYGATQMACGVKYPTLSMVKPLLYASRKQHSDFWSFIKKPAVDIREKNLDDLQKDILQEMSHYVNFELINPHRDPLLWWREEKNKYPRSSTMARRYLAIPCTSAESERLFSIAGDIVTDKQVIKSVPILNKEQKEAYESILNSIVSDSGRLFFLDAPGGTGKTFLINLLLAKIRSEKSIAIAVASSGIADTLIDGGKTAHSTFKLPLEMNHSDNILCNISKQSYMAHVIREAKLIVWDECTMVHKNAI
ncbi:uncharacterized protein LOC128668478 [Microplitis demolitor]|uniref:uncharacterized protein LOC128668478 n=1 Tax=Microplitis demolitor TaxID=69319 RepID=UPI00235B5B2D|nr:uncharacterized protein LOC128668478 [Microplitis demolitor]